MSNLVRALLCVAMLVPPVAAPAQATPPVSAAAAPVAAEPLCRNGFFLIQGRNLLRFDDVAARHLPVRRLPSQLNALAYLEREGRFYAVAGSRVVTLTPGGALSDAGAVPHGLRGALAATSSGPNWILNTGTEIVTLRVPGLTVVSRVRLSRAMELGDWDLNPRDGMLYGVTSGLRRQLVRIDPRTGAVTVAAAPHSLPLLSSFGAVAIDPHGTLHALHNATGRMYHISLSSPSQVRWSKLGLHANESDAARCPEAWDYGDFPGAVARHTITTFGTLSIGTVVGTDDGLPRGTGIAGGTVTLELPVAVRNTTGSPALLAGWHDLDGDGRFTGPERVTATVAAGVTAVTLRWPVTKVDDRLASARLRLRLYGRPPADPAPSGSVSGGEVEDHLIPVRRAAVPGPVPQQPQPQQPSPTPTPQSPTPAPPSPSASPPRQAPAIRRPMNPPATRQPLPLTLTLFAGLLIPLIAVAARAVARKGRTR